MQAHPGLRALRAMLVRLARRGLLVLQVCRVKKGRQAAQPKHQGDPIGLCFGVLGAMRG
jgi:hypothetical protein